MSQQDDSSSRPNPGETSGGPSRGHHADRVGYWRANQRLIAALLFVWGVVSLGCSIFFVEFLNRFSIGKLPLGFWFGQQGSIYVFVVLILIYAVVMDRLDRKYEVEE